MHVRNALDRPPPVVIGDAVVVVVEDAVVLGADDTEGGEDEWRADDEHAVAVRVSAATTAPQNLSFIVARRYAD